MKKILLAILAFTLFTTIEASAQELPTNQDSAIMHNPAVIDTTLIGKSVFTLLSEGSSQANVSIHQNQQIADAMTKHIAANAEKTLTGYRVRIYFDNQQNSRKASEETVTKFNTDYPDIPAYRSYQNPFFKVTVGDFRTKSEALELCTKIRGQFPQAFIVKEKINFPSVYKAGETAVAL